MSQPSPNPAPPDPASRGAAPTNGRVSADDRPDQGVFPAESNGRAAAGGEDGAPAAQTFPIPTRPDVRPDRDTFNRDLSWLEFNRRVLQMALDRRVPLLERVKFLAIFSNNLDEFTMKRVGWIKRRLGAQGPRPRHDDLPPQELLDAVRAAARQMQRQQAECFQNDIRPALAGEGIELVDYQDLAPGDRARCGQWYRRNVFPVLTPLAVDPGHRFPFISNLSRNFGVLLADPAGGEPLFARVKVPPMIRQWVPLPASPQADAEPAAPGTGRFVSLRDLIQNNLDDLFPGMRILEVVPFRLTRDSETASERDDADNLLELVEAQLKRRRFAHPVHLAVGPNPSPKVLGDLLEELGLTADDVDERAGPLDYVTLFELADLDRPDLKWPRWRPVVPPRLRDDQRDVFSVIREGDLLVHHPYESFDASAERFIRNAAEDPQVVAIKQTIYRTSRDSPFIRYLIRAAERGKQVACLVELRARFDEQSNVRLARMLEKAGVHVAYGVVGLKTHCKASLVVRQEDDGLRSYAHIGTGNYHPKTSLLYTDLGLFTCAPDITDDVMEVFNLLTGRSLKGDYNALLVAPTCMKRRFLEMIARETELARGHAAGKHAVGGRIVAKMNALEDREVTDALYEASAAGVQIALFVRGFCCLRPGMPGKSENIRVISVVGRFLEHSRVFHFGAGRPDPADGEWFISSADWMHRNLHDRVEAACPVRDRASRRQLLRILQVMAADHRKAWDLHADGSYTLRSPPPEAAADSPQSAGTFEVLWRDASGS